MEAVRHLRFERESRSAREFGKLVCFFFVVKRAVYKRQDARGGRGEGKRGCVMFGRGIRLEIREF